MFIPAFNGKSPTVTFVLVFSHSQTQRADKFEFAAWKLKSGKYNKNYQGKYNKGPFNDPFKHIRASSGH